MAATNFTPIILYHTTTASAAPTAGNLNNGELAINITDGKLFYKDNGGVVQVIATKGTGTIGGSNTQVQYNNAGALAGSSNFTFNGTTATINTLNLTNALGTTYGGTGLNSYTTGDVVYASGSNTLAKLAIGANTYILTSTGSVPQWSAPSSVTVSTATNLAGGAAGSVPYQSGASTTTFLSIGSAGQVLTSSGTAPQWSNLSSLGVTSLSFGTTGLTPSTATQGAITVAGTLATTNGGTGLTSFTSGGAVYATSTSALTTGTLPTTAGGTGLTSFTANGVVYASSASALTTGSALSFNGSDLTVANGDLTIATNGKKLYVNYIANNSGTDLNINAATNSIFAIAGSEQMRLTSTGLIAQQGAVFNESGANSDFRVESDNTTHMLFVNAASDKVAIGSSAVYTRLTVSNGNSARTGITLSDANTASMMLFAGNSSNGVIAVDSSVGIDFQTSANVGQENGTVRARIGAVGGPALTTFGSAVLSNSTSIDPDDYANSVIAGNIADGSGFGGLGIGFRQGAAGQTGAIVVSGGGMYFGIGDNASANSITGMLDINRSAIVFNENSLDTDFRVESDTNTHAFFLDAGNSRVGLFTSAPASAFDSYVPTNEASVQRTVSDTNAAIAANLVESRVASFNVASGTNFVISNTAVSASGWRVIFRGTWSNNYEGGGLAFYAPYIEVNSANPSTTIGSRTVTVSRNGSGFLIVNSGDTYRNSFAGTIEVYDNPQSQQPNQSMRLLGGIQFPATQNTSSNANTLDDYEEGTWTPTDASGAGLSFTVTGGFYTKVGNLVTCWFELTYPSTSSSASSAIGGLPFPSKNVSTYRWSCGAGYNNKSINDLILYGSYNSSQFNFYISNGNGAANSSLSNGLLACTFSYQTD